MSDLCVEVFHCQNDLYAGPTVRIHVHFHALVCGPCHSLSLSLFLSRSRLAPSLPRITSPDLSRDADGLAIGGYSTFAAGLVIPVVVVFEGL